MAHDKNKTTIAFRDFIRLMTAFDVATLGYIIFTFIYILIGYRKIHDPLSHLGFRIIIAAFIIGVILLHRKYPGTITAFIRYFYPLALLAYWYTETFFLHGAGFPYIDPAISRWEEFIFGFHPSFEFSKYLPFLWFSELLYFAYFSFYVLIFLVCLIIYIKDRQNYHEALYILLFSFYLFYVIFAIVPSMGPHYWFAIPAQDIPGGYFFSNAVMLAQELGEKPTGAFPSSHVGISVLLLCICFRYIRIWFWIFLPVVLLLCAATVYIKAHYLLDVVGGVLCVPLLWWLSRLTYKYLRIRPRPSPAKVSADQ